jgi:hypothetical protein
VSTPEVEERLDALWDLSTSLSMMNFAVADAFGLQHFIESAHAGSMQRHARALGYEAAFSSAIGWGTLRRRARQLLARQASLLKGGAEPFENAWAHIAQGTSSWLEGRFGRSADACKAAIEILRRDCVGAHFYVALVEAYRLSALAYRGRLEELEAITEEGLEATRRRNDTFGLNNYRLSDRGLGHVARDRPRAALEAVSAAQATWPTDSYHTQALYAVHVRGQALLYAGELAEAWAMVEAEWPRLRRGQYLLLQVPRIELLHLRGRAGLAAGTSEGLRAARRCATRLRRESLPFGVALGDLLLAGLGGAEARAAAARARAGLDALALPLHADAAGWLCARLEGRPAAAAAALSQLRERGVVRPEELARTLAPSTSGD